MIGTTGGYAAVFFCQSSPSHAHQHQAALRPIDVTLLVLPRWGRRRADVAQTRPPRPPTRDSEPEAR